jgi:hypothetical protein
MCNAVHPARTKDIFARGHFLEELTRQHLIRAGFKFAPKEQLGFSSAEGLFGGHADGIITEAPEETGLEVPCIWENKALNRNGYRNIERDGLIGLYAVYAGQVALYQAYLNLTNPALFSVINCDTCERLFFTLPFNITLAQEISDRAVTVIEATRAGELLPRITEDPEDWRCKMCGWRERCWSSP